MKKIISSIFLLLCAVIVNAEDYRQYLRVWDSNCYSIWAQDTSKPSQSTVTTETDWANVCFGNWGDAGIRNIINTAAAGGVRTIWWRINNGGLLMYPSKLDQGTVEWKSDAYTPYHEYDSVSRVIEYAHSLGVKVYAWHCPLEESHSFRDQCRSRYADLHPELTDFDIDGNPLYVPSFYYKEYRDYKISIIDEVLSGWDFDGVALDFERRGAPFRDDRYGYVPALVKEYKDKTGRDPYKLPKDDQDWRIYRAQYFEKYIDGVKDVIQKQNRNIKLTLMGTVLSEANSVTQLRRLTSERCDELAMRTLGPKGWPWAGDPKHAFCKINDIDVPKRSHVIYTYFDSKEVLMQKALESLGLGMTICWFETTPMYTREKYSISSEITMVKDMTAKKQISLPENSESAIITVIGLCDWSLYADSKKIAEASYGKTVEIKQPLSKDQEILTLTFKASRVEGSTYRGLAANIKVYSGDLLLEEINSDRDWDISSTSEKFEAVRVGKPGAFPFIEQTKDGIF